MSVRTVSIYSILLILPTVVYAKKVPFGITFNSHPILREPFLVQRQRTASLLQIDRLRGGQATASDVDSESEDETDDHSDDNDEETDSKETAQQSDDATDTLAFEPNESADQQNLPDDNNDNDEKNPIDAVMSNLSVTIQVTTASGSALLDQSAEITAHGSRTVAFVKRALQKQFPGRPPVEAMRLIYGGKVLQDDMLVNELVDDSDDDDDDDQADGQVKTREVLLVLDMIPPVDPKSKLQDHQLEELTVSELLDAYAMNEAAVFQNAAGMVTNDKEEDNDDGNDDEATS
jgi:hypothetical protein